MYRVERQTWGVPCDHPSCARLHRRLAKEPYSDGGYHDEWVATPHGDVLVRVNRWHEVTRFEWLILDESGERVETGEQYHTKRDAALDKMEQSR
jgi:hypothetical protein